MQLNMKPAKADSLKEVCVGRFEELILSGKLSPGQKLPPERELAKQLDVSRPIVHEALVDLSVKGLVSLKPRVGAVVNDYRKDGSLALLSSLLKYHQGSLEPRLLKGLLDMRFLFERENARLAARNRSADHIRDMNACLKEEREAVDASVDRLAELDFQFHLLLSIATDNMSYPLLLNSFKPVYTNLTRQFFSLPSVVQVVHDFHADLVSAVDRQDEKRAVDVMTRLLEHGEKTLETVLEP